MESYYLEIAEDMAALRIEDKAWIREEIRASIHEHLNPHGWRKLQGFLPLVGVLTLFVALLALAGGGWNYAFSRVEKEARFETSTIDRLDRIDAALKLIPVQIAAAKYSSVPPQELKAHRDELMAVKTSVATADKNAPSYWQVSFQVINLLSMAVSYIHNPKATESTMDNISGVQIRKNGDVVVLKHEISDSVFEDSVIRFDPSVRLHNVTFKNCVFIFPVTGPNPAKPLQDIGNALLMASDISEVSISTS